MRLVWAKKNRVLASVFDPVSVYPSERFQHVDLAANGGSMKFGIRRDRAKGWPANALLVGAVS
jgi:hypothetical protein